MDPFNFQQYYLSRKALIDAALDRRLPQTALEPCLVHEAMRYVALSGGKRLRPILSLAVADVAGAPTDSVMDAACGIELLHAASLVIDDLPSMDDAPDRRGQPSAHVKYGEATAILAAMGLVALSFDLVARAGAQARDSAAAVYAVRELARVMGTSGIIHGQHADLHLQFATGETDLEAVSEQKAASLFLAAIDIPAHLVGLGEHERKALSRYGRNIGLSFQITDDILDATDAAEGASRPTHVSDLGPEGARERVAELITDALDGLSLLGNRAVPFRALAEHVKTRTV